MQLYQRLQQETEEERDYLMAAPIFSRVRSGEITLGEYGTFLLQAYHHVKHTVPLLMATGAKLPEESGWLRKAVAEYIDEEYGHEEWILSDIAAAGFDADKARSASPNGATELMVAYAYDTIERVNPLGFFGMVQVLEGTSVAIALKAADAIQQALGLPDTAYSYLRSHGELDLEHMKLFEGLMNRIIDPTEQAVIVHGAQMFYRLYGDLFRSLKPEQSAAIAL